MRRSYSTWAALLLGAWPLMAQAPAEPPIVRFRNSVRLVEVDVVAKDRHGKPISDLEAKDFSLFDNGRPQKITHLSVERGPAEVAAEATAAETKSAPNPTTFSNLHPGNTTPTVILFDVLNTAAEDQPPMRRELLQSLHHIKDGTPVALLILGDDLTVVSDFTSSTISLGNAAGSQFDVRAEGFGPGITARTTGNVTRDRIILKAATQAFRADEHERVVRTLAALNIICNQLARMCGRKSLLWITGGLNVSSDTQVVDDVMERLNDANVAVYTVDARGVLMDPNISAENDTNDMTAPMKEEREEVRNDVLAVVANSTGGVFYHNNNRLDTAINQAMDDRSLVYVLEYYPQHGDWQGNVHKLEVKTSRPGVHLRYRASYRATPPAQPSAQDQQQMLAAVASSPLDYAGIRFNVEVKPGPPADPHFILHIPAEEVQWSAQDGKMSADLQVWIVQKQASGVDVSTSSWKSNLRLAIDAYEAATRQGVILSADLKTQPPTAKFRVLVRDANSGKVGSVDVPVDSTPPTH